MARARKLSTPDAVTVEDLQALYLTATPEVQDEHCLWLLGQPGSKVEWIWDELKKDIDRETSGRFVVAMELLRVQRKLRRKNEDISAKQIALEKSGLTDSLIAKRLSVTVDAVRRRRGREGRKRFSGQKKPAAK